MLIESEKIKNEIRNRREGLSVGEVLGIIDTIETDTIRQFLTIATEGMEEHYERLMEEK